MSTQTEERTQIKRAVVVLYVVMAAGILLPFLLLLFRS